MMISDRRSLQVTSEFALWYFTKLSGPLRTKLSLGTLGLPQQRPNKIMSSNPSRGWIALISAGGRRAELPDFSYIQLVFRDSMHLPSMRWHLTSRSCSRLVSVWLCKSSRWHPTPSQALSGWEVWGRRALWDRPPAICINPRMWQWHTEGDLALCPLAADGRVQGSPAASLSWAPAHKSRQRRAWNLRLALELCMEKRIQCEIREMLITMSNY